MVKQRKEEEEERPRHPASIFFLASHVIPPSFLLPL